jgi:hypothetical protein
MSQLVLEHYGYNTMCMTIFSKTTMKICLDAHIRTIIVLTGGKLTGIYFPHLRFVIYFSVTMHRQKCKKVSILPLGDVNPGPFPQNEVCLRTVPIMW